MNAQTVDEAKRACLKQSFGGTLDESEREILGRYLATAEGQSYLQESKDVQRLLGDVAEVRLSPGVDSKRMVAEFESMARRDMRQAQRWLPVIFLLGPGALAAVSAYCLSRGGDVTFLGWTLCVWAALFALLFLALWWKQRGMIDQGELFASLESDRKQSQSRPVVIRTVIVLAALYLSIGIGVWNAGGFTVLAVATVVTVLFSLWLRQAARVRYRQQEEFWEWWEGNEG